MPKLESTKLEPLRLTPSDFEVQLERVYSIGLIAGVIGLAVGLFVRPVLWMGIAALVLVPLISAILMLFEARRMRNSSLLRHVLIAFAGLLLAVVIGLLLPKNR